MKLLGRNNRVITWSINQILGLDIQVVYHRLDIDPNMDLSDSDLIGWSQIEKRK